ncbi:MAG: flagellar protein FlgN [bacterium]
MDVRSVVLTEVLALLKEEEDALSGLLDLAIDEQSALIDSDFDRISSVSNQMLESASKIDAIEARRLNLLRTVHAESMTLEELLPLAEDLGINGFALARGQMLARARELKEAQEQNARLLLNAMKLRDRWANLLGGFAAPGYSNKGRRNTNASRGTVSRSA